MSNKSKRPVVTRTGLITGLLALTLPFIADVIIFGGSGHSAKIFSDPAPLIGFAAYTASVFWLLDSAMRPRPRVERALKIGLIITALIWLAFALTGMSYQVSESYGNANIGLYIFLMIWPLLCVILMGIIAKYGDVDHDA